MPTLPKQRIYVEAEDGTSFDKEVTAGVTKEGIFTLGLPVELYEIADEFKNEKQWRSDIIEIAGHRRDDTLRLRSHTMGIGINFIKACAEEYLKVETVTERVIVYHLDLFAHFWLDKAGKKITQNGCIGEDGGGWWKHRCKKFRVWDSDIRESYRIGIGAEVFDRTTYKRKTGDTVTWKRAESDMHDDNDPITRLHSFTRLYVDPEGGEKFDVMPYTPEAAEFFTKLLLGICQMVKNVDEFFADKERLTLAINSGKALPFA